LPVDGERADEPVAAALQHYPSVAAARLAVDDLDLVGVRDADKRAVRAGA
jgi:hypothetical protein